MNCLTRRMLLVYFVCLLPIASRAQQPVGVVSHVKVLSDKVLDVSSMEAWERSFIRDGMSDREKIRGLRATLVQLDALMRAEPHRVPELLARRGDIEKKLRDVEAQKGKAA